MALTLGDNFSYQGAKPLDARLKYETVAAMKAVADATMYDGCLAYCAGTDKTYQWKSGNTVDETTGKWREFNSGGGGGGGETYTAGDGIDISGENVISTEKSQNGWMDEVIEKVPMSGALVNIANAFNRSDLYSETERIVGQWIDGKPLYQKTFNTTEAFNVNASSSKTVTLISSGVDKIINQNGYVTFSIGQTELIPSMLLGFWEMYVGKTSAGSVNFVIANKDNSAKSFSDYSITIQYTKTTDSAIAIGSDTDYSTDEKIVGTWIDGKPLYQKTFTGTSGANGADATFGSISNAETIVSLRGIVRNSNNMMHGAPNPGIYLKYYNGNIQTYTSDAQFGNQPCSITVQYTKLS